MKYYFSLIFVFLFFAVSLNAQTVNSNYMDGMLYFQLEASYPMEQVHVGENDVVDRNDFPFLDTLFQKYGVNKVVRPFYLFGNEKLLRVMEVHFDKMELADEFVSELSAFEQIAYAEKVPLHRLMSTPNDPYYGIVNNRNWKWHLDMIKADSAWTLQSGKSYIKVAVVDGFVWGDHPDLQMDSANLCTVSYNTSSGGYTYSVGSASPPSSVTQNSSETAYSASHGTHCAGLVGAKNNNNIGIASIGSGVTVMGVAATSARYLQYVLYGMQGVQWAAQNGARVITMSFGGSSPSNTQELLMQTCYDAGIVLLASAGNEGDEDNNIIYPAGYNTVISVASVDGDGRLSYFSQWGVGRADIASPGGFIAYNNGSATYPNILSTTYNLSYVMRYFGFSGTYYDGMQGTSMACPLAAGVVGLMLSKDSSLTPDAVKKRLQMTATPLNSNSEHTIDGYGYINAYAAMLYKYALFTEQSKYFSKDSNWSDSVYVSTSESWTLTEIPSWLKVNKTSGDSGITMLVMTTLSENTGAVRTGKITISTANAGSATMAVTQANYPFILNITPKEIVFESGRQQRDTICVSSTVEWTYDNPTTWLASDTLSITDDSTIIVLVTRSTNTWGRNRSAYIVFTAKGMPNDTVYVMQKMADYISLSSAVKNIGAYEGDTVSVTVYSNVNWTISGDSGSTWLKPNITAGKDTMQVLFTVLESNTTADSKTASFNITNGSINKSVTIKQPSCLGVEEIEQSEVPAMSIYPNPASSQVQISFTEMITEIQVTDLLGKIVCQKEVSGNETVLDVSSFPQGIYLVRGSKDSQTVAVSKFVKKN